MVKNKSRTANTKQASMADHNSHHSFHTQNHNSFPIPPKFKGFITDKLMSPISILDTRTFSPLTSPSRYNPTDSALPFPGKTLSESNHLPENLDSRDSVGLKLIDSLTEEPCSSMISNRKVLIGSEMITRVQTPLQTSSRICPSGSSESPEVKIHPSVEPACGSASLGIQKEFTETSEMELSEEYTCVIKHGVNSTTTHIYDDCIVEGYCSLPDEGKNCATPDEERYFLSFCHTCRKSLEQTTDIYIYRGEKAFCSHDCRYQAMLVDGTEYLEFGYE